MMDWAQRPDMRHGSIRAVHQRKFIPPCSSYLPCLLLGGALIQSAGFHIIRHGMRESHLPLLRRPKYPMFPNPRYPMFAYPRCSHSYQPVQYTCTNHIDDSRLTISSHCIQGAAAIFRPSQICPPPWGPQPPWLSLQAPSREAGHPCPWRAPILSRWRAPQRLPAVPPSVRHTCLASRSG